MAKTSQEQSCGLQGLRPITLAVLMSGVVGVLSATPLYAQQAPSAGSLLDTVKEQKAPLKPAPEMSVQPTPKAAFKAPAGFKVKVTGFKITGSTVFAEAELLPLMQDEVGKELNFEGLEQAADKIAGHYRRQGYFLAQAYLPAQEIKDGVVEIAVLEGRVGEVKLKMKPGTRLLESKAKDILDVIQPGDLIMEKKLERGLLLLNDAPGAVVKSILEPGKVVGTADLAVELGDDGRLVTGSVDFDNWGSRFTGEYRVGASLNVNNPSGYGDLLSLRAQTSNTNGSPTGRVSYMLPVGGSGTKLGASYSMLDYTLGKDFESLQVHGTAEVGSVFVLHPFIRSRNLNVFGMLGFDQKNLEDNAVNTRDEKEVKVYKAVVAGDFRDAVLGGSLNTFSLVASTGDVNFKIPSVLAVDQSNNGYKTAGSFSKLNYEYQRVQSLAGRASLYLGISGQAASKNLVSSEKFSLGGPNGVRAYPVGEASADDGVMLNAELRWNIAQSDFTVIGFVDGGSAHINHNALPTDKNNTRNIWGYGIGLNMGKPGDYLVRTSIAWHNDNAPPISDIDKDPRAWVQLSKSF